MVKREHKLDSYKLDAVSEHFIGEHKDDLTPSDIFRLQRGSAADRATVAKYCIQVRLRAAPCSRVELR